jgi:hypothetical protein
MEIGTAYRGAVVRQDRIEASTTWLASVNAGYSGEYSDRGAAMARVQAEVERRLEVPIHDGDCIGRGGDNQTPPWGKHRLSAEWEPGEGLWVFMAPNFLASEEVVMSEGNDYRQQVEEAAARVAWCERKLLFERKRHRALKDLATTEDWLDGKVCPLQKTEGTASEGWPVAAV